MAQEVARKRLPIFHCFCIDGQEIFEFVHGDVAFLARIDFRRANIARDLHIRREINAALFQCCEQIIVFVLLLWIKNRRIIRVIRNKTIFMMVIA